MIPLPAVTSLLGDARVRHVSTLPPSRIARSHATVLASLPCGVPAILGVAPGIEIAA
jgi:hypothetical protein